MKLSRGATPGAEAAAGRDAPPPPPLDAAAAAAAAAALRCLRSAMKRLPRMGRSALAQVRKRAGRSDTAACSALVRAAALAAAATSDAPAGVCCCCCSRRRGVVRRRKGLPARVDGHGDVGVHGARHEHAGGGGGGGAPAPAAAPARLALPTQRGDNVLPAPLLREEPVRGRRGRRGQRLPKRGRVVPARRRLLLSGAPEAPPRLLLTLPPPASAGIIAGANESATVRLVPGLPSAALAARALCTSSKLRVRCGHAVDGRQHHARAQLRGQGAVFEDDGGSEARCVDCGDLHGVALAPAASHRNLTWLGVSSVECCDRRRAPARSASSQSVVGALEAEARFSKGPAEAQRAARLCDGRAPVSGARGSVEA